eukprot:1249070-Pleurochrysis_carterae.AAC.3
MKPYIVNCLLRTNATKLSAPCGYGAPQTNFLPTYLSRTRLCIRVAVAVAVRRYAATLRCYTALRPLPSAARKVPRAAAVLAVLHKFTVATRGDTDFASDAILVRATWVQ